MKTSRILRALLLCLSLGLTSVFAQSAFDEAPRPLRNPAPSYPAELKPEKLKVKVLLAVFIDEKGDVSDVKVVKSNDSRFDDAAVMMVKANWKFTPALLSGKPVASKLNIPVRFDPDEA